MSVEKCYFCEREAFLCVCANNVVTFQTPPARAKKLELPPVKKTLHPSDVETIGFISKADDGDYWIDDPADIAKLFAFLKVNKIKINVGDPHHPESPKPVA